MRYFPAFLDLRDRPVFVTGGGEIAARKLRLLQKASPRLFVFSVEADSAVAEEFGGAALLSRAPIKADDIERQRPALIVAAQDDEALDEKTAALAGAHGVPVNVVDNPALCDVVIPSIVERGDMAIGISTGGAAPVIGRRLRQRLETLLPQRLGDVIDFAKSHRAVVTDAVPPSRRRAFWEAALEGDIPDHVLAGRTEDAEAAFDQKLRHHAANDGSSGAIAIVGAGPGDPELLTLKALRLLQEADIVLYDNLVADDILELIRRDAERIYVGKRRSDHSMPQEDIHALMIAHAREGRRVVRLKGGDPFIFGRGGEEVAAARAAGFEPAVVPGITAAQGCGAAVGIPLTQRGESQAVTYVTAQAGGGGAPDVDWNALAKLQQTIVVYMGVGRAGEIATALLEGGLSPATPAAVIEKGTCKDQKLMTTQLDDLGGAVVRAGIKGPAVLVIGDVAALAATGAVGVHNVLPQQAA